MVMAKDRIFIDERKANAFLKRINMRKRSHGDNVAKLLTVFGMYKFMITFYNSILT